MEETFFFLLPVIAVTAFPRGNKRSLICLHDDCLLHVLVERPTLFPPPFLSILPLMFVYVFALERFSAPLSWEIGQLNRDSSFNLFKLFDQ